MEEQKDQLEEQIKTLNAKLEDLDPTSPEYKTVQQEVSVAHDNYLKYIDRDRELAKQSEDSANYEREFDCKRADAKDDKIRKWVEVGGRLLLNGVLVLGYWVFTNKGMVWDEENVPRSDEQKTNRHFWKIKLQ